MAKKKKKPARRREKELTPQQQLKRQLKAINWRRVLLLAGNTVILFTLYRVLVAQNYFIYVFPVYGAALLGLLVGYLIYNRGLIARSLTREQLPADWPEAKKDAFFADAEARIERSKWMLTLIFPLCLTLGYEIIDVMLLEVWFG
ncbi:MAG: hypothetical protein IKD37_03225 [Clostridia bacterium]|nr:hypothetical protein [Clostridia bacterium]